QIRHYSVAIESEKDVADAFNDVDDSLIGALQFLFGPFPFHELTDLFPERINQNQEIALRFLDARFQKLDHFGNLANAGNLTAEHDGKGESRTQPGLCRK